MRIKNKPSASHGILDGASGSALRMWVNLEEVFIVRVVSKVVSDRTQWAVLVVQKNGTSIEIDTETKDLALNATAAMRKTFDAWKSR